MKTKRFFLVKTLYKKGHQFKYKDKLYNEKEWFYHTSNFSKFNEEELLLKNPSLKLSSRYLKEIFRFNVFKSTILALILPCGVFWLLSLIVFLGYLLYQYKGNFAFYYGRENLRIYLLFLALFFLVISLVLLIKIVFLKEKLYFGNKHGNKGYVTINKAKYLKLISLYNKHIQKEYIYFSPYYTKRLKIRELNEFDAEDYYQFASNPNVAKYMGWTLHKNIQQTIDLIIKTRQEYHENNIFRLGIELSEENKIIGYIGLSRYNLSMTTCEVVYALNEDYWHKGYVKEALTSFLDYLKKSNKTTIYAGHVDKNIASSKVLLSCGFIRAPQRDHKMMIYDVEEQIISYIYDERK